MSPRPGLVNECFLVFQVGECFLVFQVTLFGPAMRSATRPRGRLALVADDHKAADVADPADPVLDPPGLASETSAQSDPAGPEVRADPNAEVRVNPSVAPTATAPAAPEVRMDPTSAVRTNPTAAPVVQTGPMAPAVAAPVVRKGPAVPATAAPAVRKGQAVPATAAPMVRKGQAVPATAAPMVRKGQTVPAMAATALRTDLPVPNIVAPVVRTPHRAADSPPAPLVPLETDAMVDDVVNEDSSGQNLVADGSLPDDAPYDPLVHAETSALLEEALEISRDCVLLADMDGVLQADGEDFVNEAIPEAADSIIREVAAKILGDDAPSDGSDPPIALAKMGPSPLASPPKTGLSKSAPAGLRRAAMPVVPEHQEFDEWCAARSRTPPANVAAHPSEARASSIPPPRPHKRQAPSSDPSRAKHMNSGLLASFTAEEVIAAFRDINPPQHRSNSRQVRGQHGIAHSGGRGGGGCVMHGARRGSHLGLPCGLMSPGAVLASSTSDNCIVCRPLWRWASAILGGFPPCYASPDWVWRPIHGACSLLLLPCTTGALVPLFASARNALDAALTLSRLGLPRCFHWLFHSFGKPLVAPSEVALPRFSSMPGLLLRCRCVVCRPLWRWASAILGGYPPRYASPDWVWRPIHGTCSLLLLPCTTGALAPLFAPARNALDAALDLSRLDLP
ncbi:hypothetical protein V6N11_073142 [Hibiscus sabdariffa]|uniref:Uncharacterized protein n=1 Tax=Hibiscus sabdariffa TaxID=183260 RepID=A0ABR2P9M4_9ROSI